VTPLRSVEFAALVPYRCPSGHVWINALTDVPLVNIKCPTCSATAVRVDG
jgi:hypothetical protein